jgi:DNA invertase Pin-like site-specific DNA recombinase
MLAARRIEVIVLQLGKLDLTSAAGKLMLTMLAAVADEEQRRQIVADYAAGVSVSELARRFAVSRAIILGNMKPAA